MNNKELIQSGLLELYALDLCSPDEKILVEKALLSDEAVKKEYTEICEALDHLAADNAVEAPATVKDQLFSRIEKMENKQAHHIVQETEKKPVKPVQETEKETAYAEIPSRPANLLVWKWLSAASVVLVAISGIMAFTYYQRWQDAEMQVGVLLQKEMLLTDESGTYQTKLKIMEQKYAFLEKAGLQVATLKAKENFPGNEALVFWDNKSGDVHLVANALQPLQEGEQYQLWALDNGIPVDAGVIPVTATKGEAFKMKNISVSQGFAITIEKTGGSKTPNTEKMVVIGLI